LQRRIGVSGWLGRFPRGEQIDAEFLTGLGSNLAASITDLGWRKVGGADEAEGAGVADCGDESRRVSASS